MHNTGPCPVPPEKPALWLGVAEAEMPLCARRRESPRAVCEPGPPSREDMSQHSAYSHAAMRQNSACHYSNLFLIMENVRTSAFNLI